jgi:hypothetical protein
MVKHTKKIKLGVLRHGETWDNVLSQLNGERSVLIGSPRRVNHDPNLSVAGLLQSYHAATVINSYFGSLDAVSRSLKKRTAQTLDVMCCAVPALNANKIIIMDDGLEEIRHHPPRLTAMQMHERRLQRRLIEYAIKLIESGKSAEFASACTQIELDLINWRINQLKLPIYKQKKFPDSENFEELRVRVRIAIVKALRRGIKEGAESFLFLVHAKVAVAIQSILEKWDSQTLNIVLRSEGPPFPPNTGFFGYTCDDTVVTPMHQSWQLSPALQVHGRKVILNTSSKAMRQKHVKAIDTICHCEKLWADKHYQRVLFDYSVFPAFKEII